MNEEEKKAIEYLKYEDCYLNNEIKTVLNLIEKQQAEIEKYKMLLAETNVQFLNSDLKTKRKNEEDLEMLYAGCQAEIEKKDKIINQIKKENHDLKEKLQMFIPRRRVRRVYKMLGKILSVDIDPIILEKELKAEYKIKEHK